MIRTIIFDVDDTLYSFHHANDMAVDALAKYTKEHFGWDRSEFLERQKAAMADIKRFAGTSGGYRSRLLRFQNILEAGEQPIFPHAMIMSSIYKDSLLDHMIPEDGVETWLQTLKAQGIRLGIGSDATAQQQFLKLERLGFLQYFDFIVTSEECGIEKPDRCFFERCNMKCGCGPEAVMMIGDNFEKDYLGAKDAGYHAVWYNPKGKESPFPAEELRRYSDGPSLFARINNPGEL